MKIVPISDGDRSKNDTWHLFGFIAEIANANTRNAYYRSCSDFLIWLQERNLSLQTALPIHVAAWRENLIAKCATATVKLSLAAIRGFYDWLTLRQYVGGNPALSVKSPREAVSRGKTTFLEQTEARYLLASIDCSTVLGMRDRALIALMLFTFARIGAALNLRCSDITKGAGATWVLLHEKRGKLHEMPLHPQAEDWLLEYLAKAKTDMTTDLPLFRSYDRKTGLLSERKLHPVNAYAMVKRRARDAGIATSICNHSFRATGITAYLTNGGTLENAALLANHASTRTTQLYDRRQADTRAVEVQRISF